MGLALPLSPRDLMSRVMSSLAKLLAIVALLLTSFGMTAASAATVPHHGAVLAAAMPMAHCPDSDRTADTKGGVPECAMACSAALPAADLAHPQPLTILCAPVQASLATSLHGLHPDTATPPPKGS